MKYTYWLINLKYILVGAGVLPRINHNRGWKNTPDHKAWRHFFDDGYTPLEAANIDINEGGE